jgi:hypothetical protein
LPGHTSHSAGGCRNKNNVVGFDFYQIASRRKKKEEETLIVQTLTTKFEPIFKITFV